MRRERRFQTREVPTGVVPASSLTSFLENRTWLESLEAPSVTPFEHAEFPEFPGVESFVPVTVDGSDGTRAFDGSAHHGKVDVNGEYRNASLPNTFWDVWDQAIYEHLCRHPRSRFG